MAHKIKELGTYARGNHVRNLDWKLNVVGGREQQRSDLFLRTWDRPPRCGDSGRPHCPYTNHHRRIKNLHRETLVLVVETVNTKIRDRVRNRREARQQRDEQERKHQENIRRTADEIKFD